VGSLQKRLFVVKSFYSVPVCNDDIYFSWKSIFLLGQLPYGRSLPWTTLGSNMNGESVNNLLLYCAVVYDLQNSFFFFFSNRFGLSWVMSRRVVDLFAYCW
jgi:hypothetical protein